MKLQNVINPTKQDVFTLPEAYSFLIVRHLQDTVYSLPADLNDVAAGFLTVSTHHFKSKFEKYISLYSNI